MKKLLLTLIFLSFANNALAGACKDGESACQFCGYLSILEPYIPGIVGIIFLFLAYDSKSYSRNSKL